MSPQLYDPDGAPFQYRPPWLPGASNYGMNVPGQPSPDSAWTQPDPAAFDTRSITSAGISGTGNSGQPAPAKDDGKMTKAAANLLARGPATEPPPGMDETPRYSGGGGPDPALIAKSETQQPPPGYVPDTRADEAIARKESRIPPRMIGERDLAGNLRPQDIDTATGKEKTGAKVASWAQRLAMAVLAATKLAPAAMQIVHPEYSQQMGQYQAAQAADTGLIKDIDAAENAKSQAVYRQAEGQRQQALAADYPAREAERQAAIDEKSRNDALANETKRVAAFHRGILDETKGREDDVMYGLQPNDPDIPNLVTHGYRIIDDLSGSPSQAPSMKIALPPAKMQVTPAMAEVVGAPAGSFIPWSQGKVAQAEAAKLQLARTQGGNKPPTAEANEMAYEGILGKLRAEGLLHPADINNAEKVFNAIQNSKTLTDAEKNSAVGHLGAKTTPATQGTNVVLRGDAMGQNREYPVINRKTGQLEMRNAAEINASNGGFMPAGEGAKTQDKNAIFQDLHYNLEAARNAVTALGTLDAGTRAALANQLQETEPASAVSAFLHGEVGSSLSREQQHAVQTLAQLSENALSLRSVAGMGQGAQDLRDAIRSVLPSAKSASVPYMLEQLHNFEQVVNRLEAPSQQRLGKAPAPAGSGRGGTAKPGGILERYGLKPGGQ